MKQAPYALSDIKIGDHVLFIRNGIDDFRMYWTVIGFHKDLIRVKIKEMGCDDELYIDVADIERVFDAKDTRYIKGA